MSNNHRGFSSLLFLVIVVIGIGAAYAWWSTSQKTESPVTGSTVPVPLTMPLSLTITDLDGATQPMTFTTDRYTLIEIARTPTKVLLCPSPRAGDTNGCRILVVDLATNSATELAFPDEGPDNSVLPSPDGKHFVVATERRIIVIDAATLAHRVVFTSPEGFVPGTYGCLPTFVPTVRWASNLTLTVPLYNRQNILQACDQNPAPAADETKTIVI